VGESPKGKKSQRGRKSFLKELSRKPDSSRPEEIKRGRIEEESASSPTKMCSSWGEKASLWQATWTLTKEKSCEVEGGGDSEEGPHFILEKGSHPDWRFQHPSEKRGGNRYRRKGHPSLLGRKCVNNQHMEEKEIFREKRREGSENSPGEKKNSFKKKTKKDN